MVLTKGAFVAKSGFDFTHEMEEEDAGQAPEEVSTSVGRIHLPVGGFLPEFLTSTCNFQGTPNREV